MAWPGGRKDLDLVGSPPVDGDHHLPVHPEAGKYGTTTLQCGAQSVE